MRIRVLKPASFICPRELIKAFAIALLNADLKTRRVLALCTSTLLGRELAIVSASGGGGGTRPSRPAI